MRKRSTWLTSPLSFFVCGVLTVGATVPSALAAPKTIQGQIDVLGTRVDALDERIEALEEAAPQRGLMWINPLDFRAGTSALSLDQTDPGLVVTGVAAGLDVLQVGLQVPLGFSVTGARVCSVSGATQSHVRQWELHQYDATPTTPPAYRGGIVLISSPAADTLSCLDTVIAATDPSAGAMFLRVRVRFFAAEAVTIRAVGLHLEPTP